MVSMLWDQQKSVMFCRSVSLVAEGRRKVMVSQCVVVSWDMAALAVLLCMAFWIARVPGIKSCEILCFVICVIRSLFILRIAAPRASFRVFPAVDMSLRRALRSSSPGVGGSGCCMGPWVEDARVSLVDR